LQTKAIDSAVKGKKIREKLNKANEDVKELALKVTIGNKRV
jgi:hypothetical protein